MIAGNSLEKYKKGDDIWIPTKSISRKINEEYWPGQVKWCLMIVFEDFEYQSYLYSETLYGEGWRIIRIK